MVPYADNAGARLYWRERGHGEPLLMIMGLGYSSDMWHGIEDRLAARHRLLMFDNRGIGRSSVVPGPHLMTTMADDAGAVLDAAAVDRAHVFGISMGGYIAQEFALRHPGRVRSLILGSTACGGEKTVLAADEVLDLIREREHMTPEQGVRVMVPYIYDPGTPNDRIEADLEIRLRTYPPTETYVAQVEGCFQWGSFDRLGDLQAPTLVLHGANDRLIPPENGRLLADRIPGAQLQILANASHIFFTDQPDRTVAAIGEFVAAHRGRTRAVDRTTKKPPETGG